MAPHNPEDGSNQPVSPAGPLPTWPLYRDPEATAPAAYTGDDSAPDTSRRTARGFAPVVAPPTPLPATPSPYSPPRGSYDPRDAGFKDGYLRGQEDRDTHLREFHRIAFLWGKRGGGFPQFVEGQPLLGNVPGADIARIVSRHGWEMGRKARPFYRQRQFWLWLGVGAVMFLLCCGGILTSVLG